MPGGTGLAAAQSAANDQSPEALDSRQGHGLHKLWRVAQKKPVPNEIEPWGRGSKSPDNSKWVARSVSGNMDFQTRGINPSDRFILSQGHGSHKLWRLPF